MDNKKIFEFIKYTLSIVVLIYLFYMIFYDAKDKIGNIQIYSSDIGEMNWLDANEACKKIGDGWRLPTIEELNQIEANNEDLKGFFRNADYWSSTKKNDTSVYVINIGGVFIKHIDKSLFDKFRSNDITRKCYVRPVRTLK